jgi:hypothetical protein
VEGIREVVLGQSDLEGTYHAYAKLTGLEEALKHYKGQSESSLFELNLIRREAERKMGQLLLEIPRQPGARTDLTSSRGGMRSYQDVLEDPHISSSQAHRWQEAARCPEEEFKALVEDRRNSTQLHAITLEDLTWRGQQHMRQEAAKQRAAEAERLRKEEIMPKVRVLAESIPSYQVFEKRLKEDIGVVRDSRTQAAINKLVKRNYGEELAQREQEHQEREQRDSKLRDKIIQARGVKSAITYLAQLQREGVSFQTLVAELKQLGKRRRNMPAVDVYTRDEIAAAINFTPEDVQTAIAYLEGVLSELEKT